MSRGNMIDRDLFSLCGGGISCNVVCVWIVHLRTRCFFFFLLFFAHQWVLCTIHKTHTSYFSVIFSLKISLTVLFTHLKIILLQCFQFSAK